MTVEALEGAPIYALARHHAEALAVVDAVIAFSRTAAGRDGFDGLHFDIEPHGLYRWRFPEPRERMATGLVEVAIESSKRLRPPACASASRSPSGCRSRRAERRADRRRHGEDATSAAYHLIDRLDMSPS
jgi:hypothetical protein